MARVLSIDGITPQAVSAAWQMTETAPGAVVDPIALGAWTGTWQAAPVPGTAALALVTSGAWALGGSQVHDFDAHDYWYRCQFEQPTGDHQAAFLCLDGLATVAEVWLNGERLLVSESMVAAHRIDVTDRLRPNNELALAFRALRPLLDRRRPRPRWRPRLITQQALRWYRTTLLGRMPGWCPPVAPVGPWRPVSFEFRTGFDLPEVDLRTRVDGRDGILQVRVAVRSLRGGAPPAVVTLECGGAIATLSADRQQSTTPATIVFAGELCLPDVPLWWPHTHGEQPLFEVNLRLAAQTSSHRNSNPSGRDAFRASLGRVGFRTVTLDTADGGFGFRINGKPIFCRGAVWTTPDIVRLRDTPDGYRRALTLAREAGMNLLRLGGTMVYEDPAFHDLCDELGILVWQELMFANMDYPDDPAFVAAARAEVIEQLGKLQTSASLALVCGNSEVEQQAAMLGLPREQWRSPLFGELFPAATAEVRPDVPYWPSSPAGGTFPFLPSQGLAHYYGVGAYQRPLEDARRAQVRFAGECLAFSNVPDPATVESLMAPGQTPPTHPRWKERVPRDPGVGWDFEDVRDHYMERLYGIAPAPLRYADPERYLALGRMVTGEVMAATFAEWRRRDSSCRGALVWNFQDLWPGAGWGIIDAHGRPKAAYFALKRALAPFAVWLMDEGTNGLYAHAANDGSQAVNAQLEVRFLAHGRVETARAETPLVVPAGESVAVHIDALLEGFRDTTHSYRFGPPSHHAVVATLTDLDNRRPPSRAAYFPQRPPISEDPGLSFEVTARAAGPEGKDRELVMRANALAYGVFIESEPFRPDDNHFVLEPGRERVVLLRREEHRPSPRQLEARVFALNLLGSVRTAL